MTGLGLAVSLTLCVGLISDADASHGAVRGCASFVLSESHDEYGPHRFWARDVKRSAHLRCSMARNLLRAAYGIGPLKVIKKTYEMRDAAGNPIGRPTYWLNGGWRCGNGAGGAACWNAEKPVFNAIEDYGVPKAVTASTG